MTKLYKDGITRNTESPTIVAELKRAGYEIVEDEPAEVVVPETNPLLVVDPTGLTVGEIYELCEKAGVNPDDLDLKSNPTLADVKSAIKAAKAEKRDAKKDGG